jgi:hypothetical protein
MESINEWFTMWVAKLNRAGAGGKGGLEAALRQQDEFLVKNLDFVQRRERFKAIFDRIQRVTGHGGDEDAAESSAHDEVATASAGDDEDNETPIVDEEVAPSLHDLFAAGGGGAKGPKPESNPRVFDHPLSMHNFRSNAELLREMTMSTLRLLHEKVVPELREVLRVPKNALVAPRDRQMDCGAEVALLILTITDCIVAPALRDAASELEGLLFCEPAEDDAGGAQDEKHPSGHRRRNDEEIDFEALEEALNEMITHIDSFVQYCVQFYRGGR